MWLIESCYSSVVPGVAQPYLARYPSYLTRYSKYLSYYPLVLLYLATIGETLSKAVILALLQDACLPIADQITGEPLNLTIVLTIVLSSYRY